MSVRLKDQLISNEHNKGLPLLSVTTTTGVACFLSTLLQGGASLGLQKQHTRCVNLLIKQHPI